MHVLIDAVYCSTLKQRDKKMFEMHKCFYLEDPSLEIFVLQNRPQFLLHERVASRRAEHVLGQLDRRKAPVQGVGPVLDVQQLIFTYVQFFQSGGRRGIR